MSEDVEVPRARRGRPSRQEAAGIDRDILAAARACFVAGGFDETTMEAVAERAGVTKKTLYLRYPDKGVLLKAVLRDRLEQWGKISSQNDWQMGPKVEDKLRYFAKTILRHSQNPEIKAFVKLVDGSFGWAQSIGREFQESLRSPMLHILTEIMETSAEEGVSVKNARNAAATFLGMLSAHPFADLSQNEDCKEALDAFADYTTDVFLNGRKSW